MKESSLIKVFDGLTLVDLQNGQQNATDAPLDTFEIEVLRIFNEHKQLKAELKETEEALMDLTKLFALEVEKHRWIPVSEGLPKKSGVYLVCDFTDSKNPNFCVSWFEFGNLKFNYSGTHWQPITLPEGE